MMTVGHTHCYTVGRTRRYEMRWVLRRFRNTASGAVRGELPSDAKAVALDGLVIFGSCSETHDKESWILALVDLVGR